MAVSSYIKGTYEELIHKVSWPTWSELQNSALVVMVASVIIALIVYLMDVSFKNVLELIYSIF
ncbi:MAG: preprotein translocase subunit SecE [Bacteroidota bacterium]|nr:preprotein translocase subunit SecE [Bacteroidota bacterium]